MVVCQYLDRCSFVCVLLVLVFLPCPPRAEPPLPPWETPERPRPFLVHPAPGAFSLSQSQTNLEQAALGTRRYKSRCFPSTRAPIAHILAHAPCLYPAPLSHAPYLSALPSGASYQCALGRGAPRLGALPWARPLQTLLFGRVTFSSFVLLHTLTLGLLQYHLGPDSSQGRHFKPCGSLWNAPLAPLSRGTSRCTLGILG